MNSHPILNALRDAIDKASEPQGVPDLLSRLMSSETPRAEPKSRAALIEALRSEPKLRIFAGLYQILPGTARQMSHEDLADWLIARGAQVGAETAIEDLQRYVTEDELPVMEIVAVTGVAVAQTFVLLDDLSITPWHDLPPSTEKIVLEQFPVSVTGVSDSRPTAAIVRQAIAGKLHSLEPASPTDASLRHDELVEVCRLLTLLGPSPVVPIGIWWTPAPWVPRSRGFSFTGPVIEPGVRRDPYIVSDPTKITEFRETLCAYQCLPAEIKARLRVPLDRLNQAMRRLNPADRAIDLGIAIEALFLSDQDSGRELLFRMRLRAARFLEVELERRRRVSSLVGELYKLRSKAAHEGRIELTSETLTTLREAEQMVSTAVSRVIRGGGPPVWSDLELV